MTDYADIHGYLLSIADPVKAKTLQRFFKTGPGEYGEGDVFIGIKVPDIRKAAKIFKNADNNTKDALLKSPIHEERLLSLVMLVTRFQKSHPFEQERIFDYYLTNTTHINNWDLVDSSAEHIIGAFLFNKECVLLNKLASSRNLWERRIAVMATFHFIKKGRFAETFELAEILIQDKNDLIHKAVGWMLREIGKRDLPAEELFLKKHYRIMPRTMLRYATEKFQETIRQDYLRGQCK